MRRSRGCFEPGLEGGAGLEDGPEDIDAPAGQGDDGLMVAFSLAPLAVVEGAAVVMTERAEGGLVEDALEAFVAADGTTQKAGLAGLAQNGSDAAGRGERVGRAEAGEIACLGDEFGGEHGPHAGQAADEGRVRVVFEQRLQLAIEFAQAVAAGQGLASRWRTRRFLPAARSSAGVTKRVSRCSGPLVVRSRVRSRPGKMPTRRSCRRARRWVCPSTRSRRRPTSKRISRSSSLAAWIGRRSLRARTWSAMVRASRGSDLFSPPLVPWRATVDRQARDVNEGEAGRGEHRLGQAGDAADHIQADADRAAELAKLGDELRDLARRIGQLAVDPHDAIGVDRGHPMHLLGNVDPDADPHGAPPAVEGSVSRPRRRRPTQRWIAEPNQRSRRCGGAGGSASRTIMGSQHENHPDTAAAPRSWHARIVVSGTAEAASRR
jgi:hypothetical protein